MTDPIVGIDLGTSNSVVAHADAAGQVKILADDAGGKVHPSVVSFHPNGGVVVGAAAKQRKVIDPSNTIYSVKRLIGRAYNSPEVQTAKARSPFKIKEGPSNAPLIVTRGGEFAVPEISAIVLDHVRNVAAARLETAVNRAVVTVPASFNDAQRSATATAGAIAGLTVVRVLNEPTAAALAYGHTRSLREIIAVYDFGGGTFDITFLKLEDQVYEVLGTSGDTFLGGDDLDERLVEKMVAKFLAENRMDLRDNEVAMMRLRAVAEQTKIELSRRSRAVVRIDEIAYGARGAPLNLQIEISRDEFVREVADLIDRTFPVCAEALGLAGLGVDRIADVILVGGSTKIPYVREQVAKFFGKPARTDVNPEDAVAAGAALQATALERILARRPSSKMRALARPGVAAPDEPTTTADLAGLTSGATMAPSELSPAPAGTPRPRQTTAGYAIRPPTEVTKPDTRYSMTRSGVRDEVAEPERYPVAPPPPAATPPPELEPAQPIGRITRSTPTVMAATPPPPGPKTAYGVPAAPAAFEVELSNSVEFPEVPVRPPTAPGPAGPPTTVAALPPPVPRRTAGAKAQLAPHQTTMQLPPDLRAPGWAPQEYPALELSLDEPALELEPTPAVTQPLAPLRPIAPATAPTMTAPGLGGTTARGLGVVEPDPATTARGFPPPPSFSPPSGASAPAGQPSRASAPASPRSAGAPSFGPPSGASAPSGQASRAVAPPSPRSAGATSFGPPAGARSYPASGASSFGPSSGAAAEVPSFALGGASSFESGGASSFESGGAPSFESGGASSFEWGGASSFGPGGSSGEESSLGPSGGSPSFGASSGASSFGPAGPSAGASSFGPGGSPNIEPSGGGSSFGPGGGSSFGPGGASGFGPGGAPSFGPASSPPSRASASSSGGAPSFGPASAPIGYPPPSAPPPSFSAPIASAYVPPPPVLLEVTPRGLGIATVAGFSETLIRRNARVPTEARKLFTTSRDRQDTVRIVVCQGESRRLEQNTVIGDLVLQNLPPRPRGETSIEVTFSLDAGGVLQVRARDAQTGAEQRATLSLVGDVAQEEVAASRERLQQLRR